MPRTIVPEEQQRATDETALKDVYPSGNRTVHVDSVGDSGGNESNIYYWDPNDTSSQNPPISYSSNLSGFNGLWKRMQLTFGDASTDDLAEGAGNLYFTEQRAQDASVASVGSVGADDTFIATTKDDNNPGAKLQRIDIDGNEQYTVDFSLNSGATVNSTAKLGDFIFVATSDAGTELAIRKLQISDGSEVDKLVLDANSPEAVALREAEDGSGFYAILSDNSIAKYDENLNVVWSENDPGPNSYVAPAETDNPIATDGSTVYITGNAFSTGTFDTLVELTDNGSSVTVENAASVHPTGSTRITGVAVQSGASSVYIVDSRTNIAEIDVSSGNFGTVLTGRIQINATDGDDSDVNAFDVDFAPNGNLYVAHGEDATGTTPAGRVTSFDQSLTQLAQNTPTTTGRLNEVEADEDFVYVAGQNKDIFSLPLDLSSSSTFNDVFAQTGDLEILSLQLFTVEASTTKSPTEEAVLESLVDVSDSGSQIVQNASDINFGSSVNVTDDGDRSATVDVDGADATSIDVDDSGTDEKTGVNNLNFANLLDVSDGGSRAVNIDINDDLAQYDFSNVDTDDLNEGSTNRYFTDSRAITAIEDNTNTLQMSGDISMNSNEITSLPAPNDPNDAARKAYVDAVAQGLEVKDSVDVATDGTNIDLGSSTDPNPIDGITVQDGEFVLLKNQTDATENGIYVANTATDPQTWTRRADFDEDSEVQAGAFTFVEKGTNNADTAWILTTNDPITVDTDGGAQAQNWSQFSSAGEITAGDGLTKSGQTLDINVSDFAGTFLSDDGNNDLEVNISDGLEGDGSDNIRVDEDFDFTFTSAIDFSNGLDTAGDITDGATTIWDSSAGEIPDGAMGTIENSTLANDSVTVTAGDGLKGGGSASLGGSTTLNIEPADFAGSGLEDDGSDDLALINDSVTVTAGDGLKNGGSVSLGGSTTIDIEPADFAGNGLVDSSDDLELDIGVSDNGSDVSTTTSIYELNFGSNITVADNTGSTAGRVTIDVSSSGSTSVLVEDSGIEVVDNINNFDFGNALDVVDNTGNDPGEAIINVNEDVISGLTGFLDGDGTNFVFNDFTNARFKLSFNYASGVSNISQGDAQGIAFNNSGTKMFIVENSGSTPELVQSYSLSDPFDLSTATPLNSLDISSQTTDAEDITFNDDGSKMYIGTNPTGGFVYEYDLNTNFDITTTASGGSADRQFDVTANSSANGVGSVVFDNDGDVMLIMDFTNVIYEFDLSTSFDVTTATSGDTLDTSGDIGNALIGLAFNEDGTRLFAKEDFSNPVYQYDLSTAYDISTASFSDNSFQLFIDDSGSTPFAVGGITVADNGDKMYMVADDAIQYDLVDKTGEYNLDLGIDDSDSAVSGGPFFRLNFGNDLEVTNDATTGRVTIDATQSSISDSGSQVIDDTDDFNFGNGLSVTDDGDGTATIANDIRTTSETFSGDGSTTQFDIPHGLSGTPSSWTVEPTTDDASAYSHSTADSTNITVVYDTPPPSGTDNVVLNAVYSV